MSPRSSSHSLPNIPRTASAIPFRCRTRIPSIPAFASAKARNRDHATLPRASATRPSRGPPALRTPHLRPQVSSCQGTLGHAILPSNAILLFNKTDGSLCKATSHPITVRVIMTSLETAAQRFEALKDAKGLPGGIPFERIPSEVWDFLEVRFPNVWPQWFKELTTNYRLGGGWFCFASDLSDFESRLPCIFRRPSELLVEAFQYFEPIETLSSIGFVPFADGEDANVWVFRAIDGYDPPVYFTSLYGWSNECIPAETDGLTPAHMSLSEFLQYGFTGE